MLHWKNKPIDKLSKQELQNALQDSVGAMLSNNSNTNSSDMFTSFITGFGCGALICVLGVFIASAI